MHIKHRVFLALRECEVDVERKFAIGFARHKEEAHRVFAHPFDEFAERDVTSGALGNFHFLAAFHHAHHAVQQVIGVARGNADVERLQARAHASDGAVVIRALDVHDLRETALPLGDVVGHVGHEVRVAASRFAHHAVFIVAVVGGFEPQRAFGFVGVAARLQRGHCLVDAAVGVERALQVVAIEFLDAEGGQVFVLFVPERIYGKRAHGVGVFRVAASRNKLLANFDDVIAAIAVFRPSFVPRLNTARAQLHRARQVVDLIARVVVIKLAVHRAALRFEQVAQRVAERGLARVTGV